MNRISLLLMLVFVQAPPSPPPRASIQGFVLKMGTGEPLSKAAVTLTRADGQRQVYTTSTGPDGKFIVQNVEPAQYRLGATRSGYVRSEYGARAPNRPGLPITLSAGQRMTDVVVQLMAAGTIAGRVFDRDGEPLASVTVQAQKYSYRDGERVLNNVQNVLTNDLGEYRLFWLQPGQYFVSATYNGGPAGDAAFVRNIAQAAGAIVGQGRGRGAQTRVDSQGPEEAYIPVYYPGTNDVQSATPINLPAGTVFSGVDLTVVAVRAVRVRGQVINGATGQPARNANLVLQPRSRGGIGSRLQGFRSPTINDQGVFEIRGVGPGSYELLGIINDRNNRMFGTVPLEVGNADVQNVTVVISPGLSIAGRISIEGSNASAQGSSSSVMRISLRRSGGEAQFEPGQASAPVQADGTFTLQQVGPGDYRVNVAGMPRNAYVKFARFGPADVLNQGLHIERQPSVPLEIVIGTDSGAVDGTVANDKQEPAANVTVVLVPDPAHRSRSELYRSVATDSQGRFHLGGVSPGDYKLFAWEDVDSGAWQDSDFLRPFEERGRPIQVGSSGSASADLRVIAIY
jgi:5-hydroxyisourate hydrolase-like protein (transthyretin family)